MRARPRKWQSVAMAMAAASSVRAGRSVAPFVGVVIGDSITAGFVATNPDVNGYVALTRAQQQAISGGPTGEGYIGVWRSDRWAFPGASPQPNTYGPFGAAVKWTSLGVGTITMTGDSFDIYYVNDTTTGQFSVQIDSDPVVHMGAASGSPVYVKTNVPALGGAGSHVITITPPVASFAIIWGCGANIGGLGGCRIHNVGKSGADSITALNGGDLAWVNTFNPSRIVVAIGINDYEHQNPVATMSANLTALITAVKVYGPVILLIEDPDGNIFGIPQINYVNALITLGSATGCKAILNIYARWNSTWANAIALGFMGVGDPIHPINAGHADQAAALEAVIR